MIAHIKGMVAEKFANSAIIDVGGVGYEVALTGEDFEKLVLGEEQKFYTVHAVRENSEELFGFSTLMAKKLFMLLTTVQGVGPKAGMAILSLDRAEVVRNAIANADAVFVAKASGVGKKTAERVVLDLKEKVGAPTVYGKMTGTSKTEVGGEKDEALDALMALGFPLREATLALKKIDASLPVAERVRLALKK